MSRIDSVDLLRALDPRELARLESVSQLRRYSPGDLIVGIDQEVRSLYVVVRGRVRVVLPIERADGADDEDVLVRIGAGECFGEFSFADRRPASASVVADEPTEIDEIPFEALDLLMSGDADLAVKLLRAMYRTVVGRLRATDADLAMAHYLSRCV